VKSPLTILGGCSIVYFLGYCFLRANYEVFIFTAGTNPSPGKPSGALARPATCVDIPAFGFARDRAQVLYWTYLLPGKLDCALTGRDYLAHDLMSMPGY
jgi:hypothetical protein